MYEHFGARHLGVKGPGALTELEEGVMGVLPLDMSSDPAYWFIQGIRVYSKAVDQAGGGAGTYAKVGLSIEDKSDEILARILGVWIASPTATSQIAMYRCLRTAFSSDPGVYGTGLDTRIAEAQPSQAVIINASDGSSPGTDLGIWTVGINQYLPTEMPITISPLESIYFINWTADEKLKLTLVWAEIPAYRAEL
jgi:hypothetical protein